VTRHLSIVQPDDIGSCCTARNAVVRTAPTPDQINYRPWSAVNPSSLTAHLAGFKSHSSQSACHSAAQHGQKEAHSNSWAARAGVACNHDACWCRVPVTPSCQNSPHSSSHSDHSVRIVVLHPVHIMHLQVDGVPTLYRSTVCGDPMPDLEGMSWATWQQSWTAAGHIQEVRPRHVARRGRCA